MPRIAMIALAALPYIYCLGYVSFFSYFGSIAGDAWWLNIPTKDLLVRGVLSMFFTKAWVGFLFFVVFLIFVFYRNEIGGFYRRKFHHKFFREWFVWEVVLLVVFVLAVAAIPGSLLGIITNDKYNISEVVGGDKVDSICFLDSDECVDGDVLYSNGDVYVLYVGGFEDGKIRLINRSLVESVDIGWSESGQAEIGSIIE